MSMADTSSIDFYFDFMSPYAYLGSVEVERVSVRNQCTVTWHPVLLGVTVIKIMGLKGVADTPLKREYVRHDVPRFARYLGIPFNRATYEPMDSLHALRAFTWLQDHHPEASKPFAQAVFEAQWAKATDMSTPAAVSGLAETVGLDRHALQAAMTDEFVKQRLKEKVDAAVDRGVFGTPTFVVDGEMFWGADRLPMVEQWIRTGGW